ncbi:MAG TPA: GNAT family N-acetyltransferase [Jatrophihabitans sp.]|jgi:RimJ/RimL family protein N-acetyltransferase|nr:GNAT family N-acetyltransferase [Jatrophihabitans sp.]
MGRFRDVELDDLELTGPRLLLRPWRPDDAHAVYVALRADGQAHHSTSLPFPYTSQDAAEFVRLAAGARTTATSLECALVDRGSGALVGSAGLRLQHDPEVGYLVYRHARGHGYAAEATRAISDWAFARDVPRVRLCCRVGNLASVRTAMNAGYRFEGISRAGTLRTADERGPARVADLARFARLADDPPAAIPPAFAPLPAAGLSDGVVRLRTMGAEDAADLADTDDELTLRWGFTGRPHTPSEARAEAEHAGLQWIVGTVAQFAIVDVPTDRFAGSLRLRRSGPPQVGGIGYVVHPAFRGRGFTSRALRLLASWAFETADFARLELGAKVGHEASLRAAAAAGFEPDGVRKCRLRNPDGTFSDEQRYALINPKYA